MVQSAGVKEHIGCISAEGYYPLYHQCPVYDTKQSDGDMLLNKSVS